MKSSIKILTALILSLIFILLPIASYLQFSINVADALATSDALPNGQPAPDLNQCQTGSTPDGATLKYTAFPSYSGPLGFLFGHAGYSCDYTKGSTHYVLYYGNNGFYGLFGTPYLGAEYNGQGYNSAGTPNGTNINPADQKSLQRAADCQLTSFNFNFQTCIWIPFTASIGSALISVTAWLLTISGTLFNWIVSKSVITFGDLYTPISASVDKAWTLFRDLSNIFIIGLFVFISVSIMLGLREFGQRKYIARIIIIALLINFSLLFTKMIVDFSNYTATQFFFAAGYQNAASNTEASIGGLSPTATGGTDIAGQFMQMAGVTSAGNSYDALNNIAEGNNSGWLALAHGLLAAALFFIAAVVLLYGSYILIVRALLIVFLLITSSAAFFTYVVPSKAFTDKGWTLWWGSLLKSAVLAPLLMIFLWATASIARGLAPGSGVLGTLASHPTNSLSINALFDYFIIIGLLLASFKVSNSIAGSIAGFNIPAAIAGGATRMAAFATGNPALIGMANRFTGRGSQNYAAGQAGAERRSLALNQESITRAQEAENASHEGNTDLAARKTKEAQELHGQAQFQDLRATQFKARASRTGAAAPLTRSRDAGAGAPVAAGQAGAQAAKQAQGDAAAGKQAPAAGPALTGATPQIQEAIRASAAAQKAAAKDIEDARKQLRATNPEYNAAQTEIDDAKTKIDSAFTKHEETLQSIRRQIEQQTGGPLQIDNDAIAAITSNRQETAGKLREQAAQAATPEERSRYELGAQDTEKDMHVSIQNEIRKAVLQAAPEGERSTIEAQIDTSEGARESELAHQRERIVKAQQVTNRIESDDPAIKSAQERIATQQQSIDAAYASMKRESNQQALADNNVVPFPGRRAPLADAPEITQLNQNIAELARAVPENTAATAQLTATSGDLANEIRRMHGQKTRAFLVQQDATTNVVPFPNRRATGGGSDQQQSEIT